jgi:hypothetical protein
LETIEIKKKKGTVGVNHLRPRQVRYQAALRPDFIAPLILNHFHEQHYDRLLRFALSLVQTAPKLCQNCAKTPSVHPRCVITDVLIHALFVRLPIQLD